MAFDAIVQKQVAVSGPPIADHRVNLLGRAAERNAERGRPVSGPAHILTGCRLVLAAGVACVEYTPAHRGSFVHGNLTVADVWPKVCRDETPIGTPPAHPARRRRSSRRQ